jgi:hypothetical protein
VPLAVAVPVSPAAAPAATTAALPPAAAATTPAALFGPIAALAVDRPVPPGFEWDGRGLSAARADYRCARAHAGSACAVAAFVLSMGGSVAASATRALLGLATGFAAPGRGVPAFLEELLFTGGKHKFLTAVATSK